MKSEAPLQRSVGQKEESSNEEKAMPGKMPPAFGFADDGGDHTKDGIYNVEKKKFDGPVSSKDANDNDEFSQDDIRQGRLNDCWFLAAAAALAKSDPEYLRSLIKDQGNGTYEVKLFAPSEEDGKTVWKPQFVVLNNEFDIKQRGGKPKYAGLGDNSEIWVMLLEKAMATLKGSYSALNFAPISDGFAALTGKEGYSARINNKKVNGEKEKSNYEAASAKYAEMIAPYPDGGRKMGYHLLEPQVHDPLIGLSEWEIIPKLQEFIAAGEAVALSTKENLGRKEYKGYVIFGPHVYTVGKIDEVNQTITLIEPSGRAHLKDLPVSIIRQFFDSIAHLDLKSDKQ